MGDFEFPQPSPEIPDSMKIDVKAVLSKVNFTDKPIIALLALHLIILVIALRVRTSKFWRSIVFGFCMLFTLLTERIGSYLSAHWREFGFSDNYFDEFGVFLVFFFALPPIVTCIILFSHLVGHLGGRLIDGYAVGRTAKAKNERVNGEENADGGDAKRPSAEEKEKRE
jgi:hypothetical protein